MIWTDSLETGIPVIDEQHKTIFRQTDMLLDDARKGEVPEVFAFLTVYVARHFSFEQAMHAKTLYPGAKAHKKVHADFVKKFKELKREYKTSGHNLRAIMRVKRFIVEWLKEHIMGHDMDFADFMKGRG